MAEKRKLLNEIDKCYKKIEEGFEIFDDIMAKMTEANSDNQREKFQDDLKKEIKKLQRLRDQIKGWQNSSEIKDKDSLSKFRKLIEQRMEIFKDVERENKTKPHSKQGLSAEDKLDPKEKEKCETIEWLNCQIRRIQDEIDRTESKLETLTSTNDTGRKRGKKEDSKKNDKEKLEELKKHLERVKFHLLNLEVCMRMINNEKLEIKDVQSKLREPLEMYIDALDPENDDDPESLDPEDIYEELNFGTYLSQLGGISASNNDEERVGQVNDNGSHKSSSPTPDMWGGSQRHQNGELDGSHDKAAVNAVNCIAPSNTRSASESTTSHRSAVSGGSSVSSLKLTRLGSQISNASSSVSSPLPQTPPAIPGIPYNSVAAGKMHTPPVQQPSQATQPFSSIGTQQVVPNSGAKTTTSAVSPVSAATPSTTPTATSTITSSTSSSSTITSTPPTAIPTKEERSIPSTLTAASSIASATNEEVFLPETPTSASATSAHGQPVEDTYFPATTSASSPNVVTPAPLQQQDLFSAADNQTIESQPTPVNEETAQPEQEYQQEPANIDLGRRCSNNLLNSSSSSLMSHMFGQEMDLQPRSKEPQETFIPPWLGASPLGMVALNDDLNYQMQMLETTMPRCPVQMDSEKTRTYLPKMPCQTPAYYPQAPLPNADSLEYYLRLSVEALFFTFYYMEGSRAQLLAAKALKKLSWRFHTKYLMWFQRHEEPKQITDDFEQGTYVYFDFEKWVQRKKEQFVFEYKYLEDKDFE